MEANKKTIDAGMKEARRLMDDYLRAAIGRACVSLIDHALKEKGYQGFTGNTQTSYACGIYLDGHLQSVYASGDSMKRPVHVKIRKGERVYLSSPYEGQARAVTGRADVAGKYGEESAVKFLMSYKPFVKKGFSVAMTTGTEYSEYLENVRDLNVLTGTFKSSRGIMLEELKPTET